LDFVLEEVAARKIEETRKNQFRTLNPIAFCAIKQLYTESIERVKGKI
jgi:hypothetical protein